MRVWFVTVVFLVMVMSPLVNHPTELEDMQQANTVIQSHPNNALIEFWMDHWWRRDYHHWEWLFEPS